MKTKITVQELSSIDDALKSLSEMVSGSSFEDEFLRVLDVLYEGSPQLRSTTAVKGSSGWVYKKRRQRREESGETR